MQNDSCSNVIILHNANITIATTYTFPGPEKNRSHRTRHRLIGWIDNKTHIFCYKPLCYVLHAYKHRERERANEWTLYTQDIFSLAENVFNLIIIYEFINASDRRRRRQVWVELCCCSSSYLYCNEKLACARSIVLLIYYMDCA